MSERLPESAGKNLGLEYRVNVNTNALRVHQEYNPSRHYLPSDTRRIIIAKTGIHPHLYSDKKAQ